MTITPVAGRANQDIVVFGIAEDTVAIVLTNNGRGTQVFEGSEEREIVFFEPPFPVVEVRPDDIGGQTETFLIRGNGLDNFLIGGAGDDQLFGGLGNDRLSATAGDDTIQGEGGRDELNGGDGDDQLEGGAGRDGLNGGFGDDLLDGGRGADGLAGGGGDDIFVLRRFETRGDVITDFEGAGRAGGDLLRFAGFGPNGTVEFLDVANGGSRYVVTDDFGAREVFTLEGVGDFLNTSDYVFV